MAVAWAASSLLLCQERFIILIDSAHIKSLKMGLRRADLILFHFAENHGSAETLILSLRVGSRI